jgi:hypothetical protein
MTRERVTILGLSHQNPERRVVTELLALVGARVIRANTAILRSSSVSPSLKANLP